jgi:hypothetical protein
MNDCGVKPNPHIDIIINTDEWVDTLHVSTCMGSLTRIE